MPQRRNRRTIGVFFNDPGRLDYPFDNPMYFESYRDFTAFCTERGVDLVIVRGAEHYLGSMQFAYGWRFVGDNLEDISGPVEVDLIYNKELEYDLHTNPGDLVVNDPTFDRVARDKWLTAQAFPDLVPVTYQITAENWREVIAKIPTDRVVLKPVLGTEGKGIVVAEKSKIDFPRLQRAGDYLAQAFIDSSGGIPGLCEGMHDLRIIVFGGKPTLAFLRLPKPGSVLSNLAQGGTAKVVDIADVPQVILDGVKQIDDYYRQYPSRIYTADFFMDSDRAYLVEVNTRPGFPHPDFHNQAYTTSFYTALLEVLTGALRH